MFLYVFIRYGLGTCYMRMSKLRLADYHFRRAADIHPNNAILLGCVGMVSQETFQTLSYLCLAEKLLISFLIQLLIGFCL